MALPGTGGDGYPPSHLSGSPYYPNKRGNTDFADDDHALNSRHKRPRYVQHTQFAGPVAFRAADPPPNYPPLYQPDPHRPHHRYPSPCARFASPEVASSTAATSAVMERTASGHSIRPDPTERCASTELLEDHEAAQRVRGHLAAFRRRNPDSKHERILRNIIKPRSLPPQRRRHNHHPSHSYSHGRRHGGHGQEYGEEGEYPLDNDALESIFSAANEIFFNGRLSQRVTWDWSHASSARFDYGHGHGQGHGGVIGTTALRRHHRRGFETLVVLSAPVLRDDPRYSRRLLISTFLHELIHCYLFICCGFRARGCGGHTPGFRDIAALMDDWVGEEAGLYLRRVEADLDLFRVGGPGGQKENGSWLSGQGGNGAGRLGVPVNVYPCSGMAAEQEEYAGAGTTAAAGPGTGIQKVAWFRGGDAHGQPTQDVAYFSRGSSLSPRPGTPTREAMNKNNNNNYDYNYNSNNSIWRRQNRGGRPLYVYTGDETPAPYVCIHPTGLGP
ncbi:hypothetical protein C7999DRAFT_16436 [Corynascus novoguineensis]|uniref:SprT-like domain-containing protein n=1 Tax=Corynascus novoguineensis TaxID=1126955 RepID=A0AAN7CQF1_9PEZI|nr:hypothetical protein C7999DRAFT_16436 [Corynascus novoguineensis]